MDEKYAGLDLKVMQVLTDTRGRATGETIPYATKIAVVTNMETETSEVIKVDTVRVVGMAVSFIEGVFQTNFMLGGMDSKTEFHVSPGQFPALFTVNRSQDAQWWADNIEGKTVFDFAEVLQWIHESGAVKEAGRTIWKMPDLVDYYPGTIPIPEPEPPPQSDKIPGVIPPFEIPPHTPPNPELDLLNSRPKA